MAKRFKHRLAKHISCECKLEIDEQNCKSNQWWYTDKCSCECKNVMHMEKIIFGIFLHVVTKMENI